MVTNALGPSRLLLRDYAQHIAQLQRTDLAAPHAHAPPRTPAGLLLALAPAVLVGLQPAPPAPGDPDAGGPHAGLPPKPGTSSSPSDRVSYMLRDDTFPFSRDPFAPSPEARLLHRAINRLSGFMHLQGQPRLRPPAAAVRAAFAASGTAVVAPSDFRRLLSAYLTAVEAALHSLPAIGPDTAAAVLEGLCHVLVRRGARIAVEVDAELLLRVLLLLQQVLVRRTSRARGAGPRRWVLMSGGAWFEWGQ